MSRFIKPNYTTADYLHTQFVKNAKPQFNIEIASKTCPIMKEERKINNDKP